LPPRCAFFLIACLVLTVPARAGHTLSPEEQQVLKSWLARHSVNRQATDQDCDCAGDIQQMRAGSGGVWKPVRDYHPYIATGDFNGDGVRDFAVVLIDRGKKEKNFALIVFNRPYKPERPSPAFFQSGMDLKYIGLAYGPPRPKPYRLLLGPFESDSGSLLVPYGRGYRWDDSEEE
jgi:hypothetical protein